MRSFSEPRLLGGVSFWGSVVVESVSGVGGSVWGLLKCPWVMTLSSASRFSCFDLGWRCAVEGRANGDWSLSLLAVIGLGESLAAARVMSSFSKR